MTMKKPGNKSRKGQSTYGELRKARKELALARAQIVLRDKTITQMGGKHEAETAALLEKSGRLQDVILYDRRRFNELSASLDEEEQHDREQELNVSILLRRILALNEKVSSLEAELREREQVEAQG